MPRGVNWIAVRTAYVVKGWTAEKCGVEFGIHPSTIKNRAAKEGWAKERDRIATNATAAATEAATVEVSAAVSEIKANLARSLAGLHRFLEGGEEDLAACKPGRNRAETKKALFDGAEKYVKIVRLGLGYTEGQSSVADEADDGRKRITFVCDEPEAETA